MTLSPGTVVLYRGHSDYESVGTMVRDLAAAFARRGFTPALLDLRAPDCVAQAVRLVRGGEVRFFVSFNGYGIPGPGQGAGFYAETQAPVLIYFVDHPAYHYPTLRAPLPRLAATFPTAHHVAFCRRHIRGDILIQHLPHAAEPPSEALCAWEARDIPLLLSASLHGEPDAIRSSWANHGAAVAAQLQAIVEAHDASPAQPLHEIVAAVMGRDDLPIEILASYFQAADTYLRSRIKRGFAEALGHLPLTVCGKGWEEMAAASSSAARFLPAMNASETMTLMRRAQLVLNPLPPYYESHERPFQAMAAGAVAVVGSSSLFAAPEFAGAALSVPAEPRAAAAAIEAALSETARLPAIAAAGTRAQKAAHSWDHRAVALLALADSVAASA